MDQERLSKDICQITTRPKLEPEGKHRINPQPLSHEPHVQVYFTPCIQNAARFLSILLPGRFVMIAIGRASRLAPAQHGAKALRSTPTNMSLYITLFTSTSQPGVGMRAAVATGGNGAAEPQSSLNNSRKGIRSGFYIIAIQSKDKHGHLNTPQRFLHISSSSVLRCSLSWARRQKLSVLRKTGLHRSRDAQMQQGHG